jgi:1,4-alpha-glucan branching enzyme
MGWMNDTLEYIQKDPIHRKYHHHEMTFSMVYAWSENFILPISHDEVVHGKGSMLAKMPGDAWEKFANLRAYYGFMWTHPGKKLLFMGRNLPRAKEWNHAESLDWHQLEIAEHRGIQTLVRDLNRSTATTRRCISTIAGPKGSSGSRRTRPRSIFAFLRRAGRTIRRWSSCCNMTPVERNGYRCRLARAGAPGARPVHRCGNLWRRQPRQPGGGIDTEAVRWHGQPAIGARDDLPPLSAVVFLDKPRET